MQGTAMITLATMMSSLSQHQIRPEFHKCDQRIIFLGAGTAATGIAGLIVKHMEGQGCSREESRQRIWLIDSKGLIVGRPDIMKIVSHPKRPFVKTWDRVRNWPGVKKGENIDILTAVRNIRPSILIGCSG